MHIQVELLRLFQAKSPSRLRAASSPSDVRLQGFLYLGPTSSLTVLSTLASTVHLLRLNVIHWRGLWPIGPALFILGDWAGGGRCLAQAAHSQARRSRAAGRRCGGQRARQRHRQTTSGLPLSFYL